MSKSRHILQLSPNLRTLNCYNCCARHTKVGQRQQQNSSQCKPVYSLACYVTQTYDVWIFSKRSRVHVMITYVALCTSSKQSTDLRTVHSQYTLYVQGYNFAHYNTLTCTQHVQSVHFTYTYTTLHITIHWHTHSMQRVTLPSVKPREIPAYRIMRSWINITFSAQYKRRRRD